MNKDIISILEEQISINLDVCILLKHLLYIVDIGSTADVHYKSIDKHNDNLRIILNKLRKGVKQ